MVLSFDLQPYVLDTWAKRRAELSNDCEGLLGTLDLSVREVFYSHLQETFDHILREAGDIKSRVDNVLHFVCRHSCSELWP